MINTLDQMALGLLFPSFLLKTGLNAPSLLFLDK